MHPPANKRKLNMTLINSDSKSTEVIIDCGMLLNEIEILPAKTSPTEQISAIIIMPIVGGTLNT